MSEQKLITLVRNAPVGEMCAECSRVFDEETLSLQLNVRLPVQIVGWICPRCCAKLKDKFENKKL